MKVIQGNFTKDKSKSLNEKLTEGLTKLEDSTGEEALRYPFILIVDYILGIIMWTLMFVVVYRVILPFYLTNLRRFIYGTC